MRTLKFLLRKEFRQIFRNRALLPMLFVMPVMQLLIMPLAANYEVRNINITIVDHDHSDYSERLIQHITASGYFRLVGYDRTYDDAYRRIESDEADLILEIPSQFQQELDRQGQQSLLVAVNAINGTKANLGGSYLVQIIQRFSRDLQVRLMQSQSPTQLRPIEVTSSLWFNPYLNYRQFMVPGILVILVTMVGAYMCSLNIVKEKEIGTIEQINVSPIPKHLYILGKLIPFWIIGIIVFTVGFVLISTLVYGIIPQGSILLLYAYLALYLIAVLGFGMLISTYSETQQQAMSIAFFFMMIFILMSGLFTPIESMPLWAHRIAELNPVTYFIQVMRMVVLKGSGLQDITRHISVMAGYALLFNGWAVLNYSKQN